MTDTYVVDDTGKSVIEKDPLALLDYPFDWSAWLTDVGDTIASALITITGPDAALVENSHTISGANKVIVWLSGGTAGRKYKVDCKITCAATTPVRVDSRSIYVKMKDR